MDSLARSSRLGGAAFGVRRERRGDISGHCPYRLVADLFGVSQGLVHDRFHGCHPGVGGNEAFGSVGGALHDRCFVGGDRLGSHVHGQGHGSHVLPVVAGLDDRPGLSGGLPVGVPHRGVPGIFLVGVAGEDCRDVGRGLVHEFRERSSGGNFLLQRGAVGRSGRCAVVVFDDDQVSGALSLDLRRNPVDGIHRITELQVCDARRSHQGRNLRGDGADHCHAQAVEFQHLVLGQDGSDGALLVDVRAKVGELSVGATRGDAVAQVLPAAVELMVANRGGLQLEGVQDVDSGLVFRHGGGKE